MQIHGWDTTFVCSAKRVNQLLQEHMSQLLVTFAYRDEAMEIAGEFQPWHIVLGGSEQLLRFAMPIKSGKLVNNLTNKNYDLAGVIPIMELQLHFIDNARVANTKELRFNFTVVGAHAGVTTPGAVTTVTPDSSPDHRLKQEDPSGVAWSMLHDAFPKMLIHNRAQLSYVFATVNLVPPSSATWLAPKRFEYLYAEPVQGGVGYLGVLASTTDRDVSHLQRAVDPALLQGDYQLYYLISQAMFMEHVVMPGLPQAYGHGATPGNFDWSAGAIRNNGRLSAGSVKWGLIHYHPHINTLTITVDDDALQSNASGRFDITGLKHAYVKFDFGTHNLITFDAATQSIKFEKDPHPSRHHKKHIPWYDYLAGGIGGPVILGVVDGVISVVSSSIASSVSHSLNVGGSLSVANMAVATVKWKGLEHFDVQDAGLATNFYLRGNYA
jgi:hypothetical protein